MFSILSLVGGGLGGLLRFVPEIIKLFQAKRDQDHEFRMSELQLKVDQARSIQAIDLVHAQSDATEISDNMKVLEEAIKGQSQLTGNKFIDGVNASVRPFLTYWWMAIFTAFKVTVIIGAWQSFSDWKSFGQSIWTDNDYIQLSMMLSFWFVDRAIKHQKR